MTRIRVVGSLLVLWAAAVSADTRPISEAERAAVGIAAHYLAAGPEAVVGQLAAASPLKAMPANLVPLEIEARLGPPAGASWNLVTVVDALKDKGAAFDVSYPSGLDETVFFAMTNEGGTYRIHDIRIRAFPSVRLPLFPPPTGQARQQASTGFAFDMASALAGFVAVILAIAAAFVSPRRRLAGRLMYLTCAVIAAGALALTVLKGDRLRVTKQVDAATAPAVEKLRVAPLLPLRRALAAGGQEVGTALVSVPKEGLNADIVRLWKAQWDFQQLKLADVKRTLEAFPTPAPSPLAEIIRARLALVENKPETAVLAYQRAINAGPGRDSLWIESSLALRAGGFDEMARSMLTRLVDLGSREPMIYYARAAMTRTAESLEKELEHAWNLQPVERADLIENGMLFTLVRKRRGEAFINLSDPREASFASQQVGTRPITLPPGGVARVSGDYLHLALGDQQIAVPGGAALAPAVTLMVGADEWSRIQEEKALADVPALLSSAPTASSYMQPAMRQQMMRSAEALATRNRWSDVVALTNGVNPKSEFIPTSLFLLRARALQRVRRDAEAKQLLRDLAASPVMVRKRDSSALEELGDMLASFDEYDIATEVFERARRIDPNGYADMRITQVAMDVRLSRQYSTHSTPHFDINYPEELPRIAAEGIGRVLEGELKRLQKWIPVPGFQRVEVNIVWWQDFTRIYTGAEDILGFYNGKITLPLAGVFDYMPEIVALITHELAHAMIAQATNDHAPHWFQEGLAQRVEMVEYSANAFNMYDDAKLLAVSVIDPVLTTSRDRDMVGAAYVLSETLVRFVDERYGTAGIAKILQAFRGGATPEEAIHALTGTTVADFDAAFRQWGRSEKRVFENQITVRYDMPAPDDMKMRPDHIGTPTEMTSTRGKLGGGTLYPRPVPGKKP
jgi:tetratricopeptide (TPR) repeat protein